MPWNRLACWLWIEGELKAYCSQLTVGALRGLADR